MRNKKAEFLVHCPCPACGGRGTVPRVGGAKLRAARESAGVSLRTVAGEMGISPAYLSDIELDRRTLPDYRLDDFIVALEKGRRESV